MSALPPLGDADVAARTVFDQVAGFGPLQQYFDDDRAVEKLWMVFQSVPVGADRLMLNLRQQWNAMSTTKIALVRAFMGLVG
jgi:hypothetical protein